MFKRSKEGKKSKALLVINNSRKAYIPVYIMIILVLSIMVYIWNNNLNINKYSILLVILFFIIALKYTEIHRMIHRWEITQDNFIHVSGLINKRVKKLDFFAISDIEVSQTPWQRLLGYGNINIHQFSEVVSLKDINHPQRVADLLENTIELKREKMETKERKDTMKKWPK